MEDERLQRESEFWDRGTGAAEDPRAAAAGAYAVARQSFMHFDATLREACGSAERVLELGPAPTASAALDLADTGPVFDGVNVSAASIDELNRDAQARGLGDRLRFHVMDAESLRFPDDTFDVVCGLGVIHHLDLPRALMEVRRVVRPGGRAIFLEPLGGNPLIEAYRRRTPSMRVPDEQPLRDVELDYLASALGRVRFRYFHCAVLALVPLRRTLLFRPALRVLEGVDGLLTRPPLGRWTAWIVVIDAVVPAPTPRPRSGARSQTALGR